MDAGDLAGEKFGVAVVGGGYGAGGAEADNMNLPGARAEGERPGRREACPRESSFYGKAKRRRGRFD